MDHIEEEEILAASLLIRYCEDCEKELDIAEGGVFGDLEDILKGRQITLQDIMSEINSDGKKHPFKLKWYHLGMALAPPMLLPDRFIEIILGEILLVGSFFMFNRQVDTDTGADLNTHVRLRDPAKVIEKVGGAMGFIAYVLKGENGEANEIVKAVNKIITSLNNPGGYLDIYTIRQLRYEMGRVRGLAHLMAHLRITIEDMKEALMSQDTGGVPHA